VEVPGCFELPVVAKELATSGSFDAIICIGAVVRGDTPHFDYVSSGTANGIQRAALDTGVPVIFGVLTVDNEEQALERIGGAEGHKGREAALTAIEMAHTMSEIRRTLVQGGQRP
jgi:6,7-dimethyl-8-ribityllumazine synthase